MQPFPVPISRPPADRLCSPRRRRPLRFSGKALAVGMFSLLLVSTSVCTAQDPAVLKVAGRGVEGHPPYRDGGEVRFDKIAIEAQVVHFDPKRGVVLPLVVDYDVLETAPILLTSRLGTEHWQVYQFATEAMSAMYTDEKIDLARKGSHTAKATRAWFGKNYGPLPESGLVAIRGHRYFLIDVPNGKWLDVVDPPAFFNDPAILRDLTFTLADLTEYDLEISEIQSTWQAGGPLRVRITVRDAQGRLLPVVGAHLAAHAGQWRAEFTTEWTDLGEPTGWMRTALPEIVPERLTVEGNASVQGPDKLTAERIAAEFARGTGLVDPNKLKIAEQGYELPRDNDGVIRETRALWVSPADIATAEGVDRLVARSVEARLNVIIPDIFVRNAFYARSELIPIAEQVEVGFDPLGYLIAKAHAAGLEVHPWFCVTYRDKHFRQWFADKYGRNIDVLDAEGKVISHGADVHRPEYRQFMIDLMVGVARDYDVDGIHLDYIRTMGRCYCDACRREYAERHSIQLAEADDAQWLQWQREAIGEIVQKTAEGVRNVRPGAVMSAAVFASMPSGAAQGQDPAGWARRGWLDVVIPMDYQMQTLQVRSNERQFLAAMSDDDQLVTGLSLYMRSGGSVQSRPPELVAQQIELVRRMGIHGYCLFAFGHMSDEQLKLLRDEVNSEDAKPYFQE